MIATIDLTGQKFGRLTVQGRCGTRSGQALWLCKCDCGNAKEVVGYTLRNGQTQSCGCLQKERTAAAHLTHGMSAGRRSSEFRIWSLMKDRCSNENSPTFQNYGARGIRVCARWEKFENFYADMGPRPSPKHTIDRIDNNGGYNPDNCRWATPREQATNKRNNIFIEFNGERLCVTHWAKRLGISRKTIVQRVKKGWPAQRCLARPGGSTDSPR